MHLAAAGLRAASAVHDLRNPLSVIETSAFILQQLAESPAPDVDRAKLRKHAKRIAEQVGRASALLHEVLDAAREAPPQLTPVEPEALARGALAAWGSAAHASVVLDLGGAALPPVVRTDAARVARIVGNLLDNARDANALCKHISTHIYLRVRASEDGARLLLCVLDDGPGLAPEVRARLFEPLVSTKGAAGTGLGLASSRALARSLGATLTARDRLPDDDAPARGAVFELALPVRAEASAR